MLNTSYLLVDYVPLTVNIYTIDYFIRLSYNFDSIAPYIFFRPSIQKKFLENTP
jgi:hypothetical protein